MAITFEQIKPALEEELSAESEVSDELLRRLFELAAATVAEASQVDLRGVDVAVEDLSGEVVLLELQPASVEARAALSLPDRTASAAVLTGSMAAALAGAMAEWQRHNGSYRDVLKALAPADRGELSSAALLQARRNAQVRRRLLEEFGALTSGEVADAASSKAANRASLANRWREEGRVFAVRLGDLQLYPAFQFDEHGKPLRGVSAALKQLGEGRLSDWQTALWFTTPSGWLGGRRPVDRLGEDPEAVAGAAGREVAELVA